MMYIRNNFHHGLIVFLICAVLCTACAGGTRETTHPSESSVDVGAAGQLSLKESEKEDTKPESREETDTERQAKPETEQESQTKPETEQESGLPAGFGSQSMYFSSGAGGWGTEIVLNEDGTFTGSYHDSEMGESGEGYLATVYISVFEGQFGEITKRNDDSYSMRLVRIDMENEPGEEWIDEEGLRFVAAEPYGLDGGTEFILYMPDIPLSELPEDFRNWRLNDRNRTEGPLSCYGLYNKDGGYGFFTYED